MVVENEALTTSPNGKGFQRKGSGGRQKSALQGHAEEDRGLSLVMTR